MFGGWARASEEAVKGIMGGSADNDSVHMRSGSYLRVDWQVNCLWKGSISRRNCSLGWGG